MDLIHRPAEHLAMLGTARRRGVLGHLDCFGFADLERKVGRLSYCLNIGEMLGKSSMNKDIMGYIIQQSHIWVCMKIGHPKIPVFFAVIFPSKWPFEGIPNFQTLTCHVMSCSHSFEFE